MSDMSRKSRARLYMNEGNAARDETMMESATTSRIQLSNSARKKLNLYKLINRYTSFKPCCRMRQEKELMVSLRVFSGGPE